MNLWTVTTLNKTAEKYPSQRLFRKLSRRSSFSARIVFTSRIWRAQHLPKCTHIKSFRLGQYSNKLRRMWFRHSKWFLRESHRIRIVIAQKDLPNTNTVVLICPLLVNVPTDSFLSISQRNILPVINGLTCECAVRLPGKGPRDTRKPRVETIGDMAQCGIPWHFCIRVHPPYLQFFNLTSFGQPLLFTDLFSV